MSKLTAHWELKMADKCDVCGDQLSLGDIEGLCYDCYQDFINDDLDELSREWIEEHKDGRK